MDTVGRVVVRKQKRHPVLSFFAHLEPCLVGLEAYGGFHHRAPAINGLGKRAVSM
jgi:transposase